MKLSDLMKVKSLAEERERAVAMIAAAKDKLEIQIGVSPQFTLSLKPPILDDLRRKIIEQFERDVEVLDKNLASCGVNVEEKPQ